MNAEEAEKIAADKSDDALLGMVAYPSNWQPEMLDAARAQLQKRGIEPARPVSEEPAPPPIPAPPPAPEVLPEIYCPECMGTLETADGLTARCQIHGGTFSILFSQWQHAARLAPVEIALEAGARCAAHPNVAAALACQHCGKPICDTCAFPSWGDRKVCLDCVSLDRPPPGLIPTKPEPIPDGVFCVQHPKSAAVQKCRTCGAYMCATCDFTFPGDIHLCPVCATRTQSSISPRRKKHLIGSFCLAGFATFIMAAIFATLAGRAHDKADATLLGTAMLVFVVGPAIAGLSLAIGAKSRQTNSVFVWIAIAWNGLLIGAILLLSVAGSVK